MAYRIDYSKAGEREEVLEKTIKRQKVMWSLALICLILLLGILYPQKQTLERLLIPGDAQVTKQATAELISHLQAGEGIPEAFQVFCEEIISNADIS